MEPDYNSDSFTSVVDDLTRTLWVQAQQIDLLRKLGIEGDPARFSDKIVIAKSCLADCRVYLHRTDPAEVGDSGWFIGSGSAGAERETGEYEALFVYQLLAARPAFMQALALPVNYMATFEGDRLELVLNGEDRPVWRGDL